MKKTINIKLITPQEQWDSLRGLYTQYVYLFLESDGTVLYIGKTGDFEKRWGEHCRNSKFDMSLVKEIEVMAYRSPSESAFAETQGILFYNPPWNTYPLKGYPSRIKIPYVCRCLFQVQSSRSE